MHLFLPLHQMFPPQQMMHAGEVSLFTNVIHSTVHVCAGIASCLSMFRGRSPEACAAWLSNFQSCLLMPAIFLQEMLAGHMGLHAGLQPLRPLNVPAGLQASAGLQGATPCTVSNPQAWPECANACQFI